MPKMEHQIDDLIAESQRIRDDLVRMAAKLEVFSVQLENVNRLAEAAEESGEHDD